MGARPLRRAIQRYIEDPLADEVLKAGPDSIEPGTTVMVDRDESGDEEDQPLKLELIPPSKAERQRREELSKDAERPRSSPSAGRRERRRGQRRRATTTSPMARRRRRRAGRRGRARRRTPT